MLDGHNILCLLTWQAAFVVHTLKRERKGRLLTQFVHCKSHLKRLKIRLHSLCPGLEWDKGKGPCTALAGKCLSLCTGRPERRLTPGGLHGPRVYTCTLPGLHHLERVHQIQWTQPQSRGCRHLDSSAPRRKLWS